MTTAKQNSRNPRDPRRVRCQEPTANSRQPTADSRFAPAALRVLSQRPACLRKDWPLMRVLIAEDDPALASFVRKGLEAEHYAVDMTTDGEQARAMAGELNYDLLMLDLNLPRLDG